MRVMRRRFALIALTAFASGCSPPPAKPAFNGTDITGANYARDFSLPDAEGKLRTLKDFRGKVTLLFFGFTHCPDVCPTTLAELSETKRQLGKDRDRVQGVLVTVDPERDTAALLKTYVTSFDPSFVALRGSPEQIFATAKEFKVFFAKAPAKDGAGYSMDHSAGSYVFDPQGRVRLYLRYGPGAKALAEDIKQLLREDGGG